MFSKAFIKNVSVFTSIILLGIALLLIYEYYEKRDQVPSGTSVTIEESGSTLRSILNNQ